MVRARSVTGMVAVFVTVTAVVLALPLLCLALDESARPPASALPTLPDGARVAAEASSCASGGCWLELTVDAPAGMSGEELAAEVVPDEQICRFRGALDLRRACTWVMDIEADSAQFNLQYERWVD